MFVCGAPYRKERLFPRVRLDAFVVGPHLLRVSGPKEDILVRTFYMDTKGFLSVGSLRSLDRSRDLEFEGNQLESRRLGGLSNRLEIDFIPCLEGGRPLSRIDVKLEVLDARLAYQSPSQGSCSDGSGHSADREMDARFRPLNPRGFLRFRFPHPTAFAESEHSE